MSILPFITATLLAVSLSAADLGYTVPLDAKLWNGEPDPRAGMHLEPDSYYTHSNPASWGDKFTGKVDVEGYVFGKSYHFNRDVNYNETNGGLGLGIAYHDDEHVDVTVAGGFYRDSFRERAQFLMPGVRYVWGDRDGVHASLGVSLGYFKGSGFHGIGVMPVASIGLDRVDLCVTGEPGSSSGNSGSTDPKDNREDKSGFVAVFVKVRLATF